MFRTLFQLVFFQLTSVIAFPSAQLIERSTASEDQSGFTDGIPAPFLLEASSTSDDVYVLPTISTRAIKAVDSAKVAPRELFHPNDGGLQLRSTLGNLTSVNGYNLYSAPIFTAQYSDVLTAARNDLLQNDDPNDVTSFYQCNHTGWSFEVVVANGTLHYASVSAIVSRYLKLIPSYDPATHVTRTRVGRVDRKENPIADIALVPLDVQPTFNSTATAITLEPGETLVTEVNPQGSTTRVERLTGQELSIFGTDPPPNLPKRQTGLEREVMRAVTNTAFAISVRLWRDPEGGLVTLRNAAVLLAPPIYLALTNMGLTLDAIKQAADNALTESMLGALAGLTGSSVTYEIGSGFFKFGYLSTRFMMKMNERDEDGNLVVLNAVTWKKLAWAVLDPLQKLLKTKNSKIYAIQGKIYGPGTNGTGSEGDQQQQQQQVLGYWELTALPIVGDFPNGIPW